MRGGGGSDDAQQDILVVVARRGSLLLAPRVYDLICVRATPLVCGPYTQDLTACTLENWCTLCLIYM